MDLKEIQLVGFKSFADKTVIRFEEGVTCIVGPNGCGKSNVSDAVRWVLGEQSAKNLRGGNMQDVIFGGTLERKPHTFCEVTLVFDNEQHKFDVDTKEVSMTRRLSRSGDSKYLLNGQPSRLSDLKNLFHGVGLGKDGYSIIGQGKVEQIMNSRPEDRRVIFEEALGLMVFKGRKVEIERKIADSSSNLFIYSQRIDEAERHLGPLSKQAEAAREYKEYSDALKVQEANTYIYRYENAENEKSKYKKDIALISDKIIDLNTRIELINRKIEDNREKINSADVKLTELNDRRVELSVGNERKDGELKLVRERIRTYRARIDELTENLAADKKRIGEIGDDIALTTKKNAEGTQRFTTLESELEVMRTAVASLDKKIEVFERLSDENRLSQLSSADDLSELKKNLGTLAARMESTKDRIEELSSTLAKAKDRKERLEDELKTVKKDLGSLRALTLRVCGILKKSKKKSAKCSCKSTISTKNFSMPTGKLPPCATIWKCTPASKTVLKAIRIPSAVCCRWQRPTPNFPSTCTAQSPTSFPPNSGTKRQSKRRSAAQCKTSLCLPPATGNTSSNT